MIIKIKLIMINLKEYYKYHRLVKYNYNNVFYNK